MYIFIIQHTTFPEQTVLRKAAAMPRIGDNLPVFCKPMPTVKNVVINATPIDGTADNQSSDIFEVLKNEYKISKLDSIIYVS
jgi:hypothetical protein